MGLLTAGGKPRSYRLAPASPDVVGDSGTSAAAAASAV